MSPATIVAVTIPEEVLAKLDAMAPALKTADLNQTLSRLIAIGHYLAQNDDGTGTFSIMNRRGHGDFSICTAFPSESP